VKDAYSKKKEAYLKKTVPLVQRQHSTSRSGGLTAARDTTRLVEISKGHLRFQTGSSMSDRGMVHKNLDYMKPTAYGELITLLSVTAGDQI
jgi:hypothetical protein